MVRPDVVLDAAGADFGNGLLIKLHAAVEALNAEEILEVRGGGPSVPEDLAAWCVLTGNALVGPLQVRKGAVEVEPEPPKLGSRLWLYSNFNCNLACDYCCAESSPRAPARHLPVELARAAVAEFVADDGTEVMVTGGEPFLHPDIGELIDGVAEHVPVTVLTNGMVFHRGNRRRTLEALDRERVTRRRSCTTGIGPRGPSPVPAPVSPWPDRWAFGAGSPPPSTPTTPTRRPRCGNCSTPTVFRPRTR
jgi:hypothetical protein